MVQLLPHCAFDAVRRLHEVFKSTLASICDSHGGHLPSPELGNSRDSLAGAGWDGTPEDLPALLPPTLKAKPPFSWLRLKPVIGGRRIDLLAKLGDPATNGDRPV